jgi:hypothetical protein
MFLFQTTIISERDTVLGTSNPSIRRVIHQLKQLRIFKLGNPVICSLLNDTVCNLDCIVLTDQMTVNNELEKMWKDAVMA